MLFPFKVFTLSARATESWLWLRSIGVVLCPSSVEAAVFSSVASLIIGWCLLGDGVCRMQYSYATETGLNVTPRVNVTTWSTKNNNSLGTNHSPKCLSPVIITSVHVPYIPKHNSIPIRCGTIRVSHLIETRVPLYWHILPSAGVLGRWWTPRVVLSGGKNFGLNTPFSNSLSFFGVQRLFHIILHYIKAGGNELTVVLYYFTSY